MPMIKGYDPKKKKGKTVPQMIYKGYTPDHKNPHKNGRGLPARIGRANPENFKKEMEAAARK